MPRHLGLKFVRFFCRLDCPEERDGSRLMKPAPLVLVSRTLPCPSVCRGAFSCPLAASAADHAGIVRVQEASVTRKKMTILALHEKEGTR